MCDRYDSSVAATIVRMIAYIRLPAPNLVLDGTSSCSPPHLYRMTHALHSLRWRLIEPRESGSSLHVQQALRTLLQQPGSLRRCGLELPPTCSNHSRFDVGQIVTAVALPQLRVLELQLASIGFAIPTRTSECLPPGNPPQRGGWAKAFPLLRSLPPDCRVSAEALNEGDGWSIGHPVPYGHTWTAI